MQIQIINPIDYPDWDELLLESPGYSFFHTTAWAKVLNESYHYTPVYFTAFENKNLTALVPVMDIKSLLTGHRGVSLPFTDMCEPIISKNAQFDEIFNYARSYGGKKGWKYFEIRGGNLFVEKEIPSDSYFSHTFNLINDDAKMFANFSHAIRKNIKRAEKEKVDISTFTSLNSMGEFYRMHCITRRSHGLPAQPYSFFENIYHNIISKGLGFITLASHNNKYIAGAVFFHFGKEANVKYTALLREYQHLRPINMIYWKAIKWYSKNGFKILSFGRTETQNVGLREFKKGWGVDECMINYHRYDLKKGSFITSQQRISGFHNTIFRHMPMPLLNTIGSLLYKHMG